MAERDHTIPPGHTPQHRPEQEPRPDPTPPQDQGDSSEFLEQLAGTHTDGTAYFDAEDVDNLQGVSLTDLYQGETDVNQIRGEGEAESYDLLIERDLREGETDDVMVAVEEGQTYVPPIDPPIIPSGEERESIEIATGFGLGTDDERDDGAPFDSAGLNEDDLTALVRRALREDSTTSHLAHRLHIAVRHGTVIIRGEVDDLIDTDNIVAVVSDLPEIEAVRDETTVRGL